MGPKKIGIYILKKQEIGTVKQQSRTKLLVENTRTMGEKIRVGA